MEGHNVVTSVVMMQETSATGKNDFAEYEAVCRVHFIGALGNPVCTDTNILGEKKKLGKQLLCRVLCLAK